MEKSKRLVFYLVMIFLFEESSLHAGGFELRGVPWKPQIIWGSSTNLEMFTVDTLKTISVQVGIGVLHAPIEWTNGDAAKKFHLPIYIKHYKEKMNDEKNAAENLDTNEIGRLFFKPTEDERLAIQIKNEYGKTLYQSPLNFHFWHPKLHGDYRENWGEDGRKIALIRPYEDTHINDLELASPINDFQPGNYSVEVTQRIYIIDKNFMLQGISLPPVTFPITVLPASTNAAPH